MKVSEFMTKNVISCGPKETVDSAAALMLDKNISVLPITNDNQEIVGLITESDFVGKEVEVPHALASLKSLFGKVSRFSDVEETYMQAKNMPLEKVMTKNPTTVSPEDTISSVVNLMSSKGFKRLPVVEGQKLVGIITRKDLIKAFLKIE